jgi:hypothetical protein
MQNPIINNYISLRGVKIALNGLNVGLYENVLTICLGKNPDSR